MEHPNYLHQASESANEPDLSEPIDKSLGYLQPDQMIQEMKVQQQQPKHIQAGKVLAKGVNYEDLSQLQQFMDRPSEELSENEKMVKKQLLQKISGNLEALVAHMKGQIASLNQN